MKTIHVVLNTRGLALAQLAVYGQSIATAMSKNSNFPNLFPGVATLQSAVDNFSKAISNAHPGNKESTANVHAAELALNRVLKAIAAHVEYVSNNDETIALSSGFSLRQPNQPGAHTFDATHGLHSGTVNLKSPARGNASYVWQFTPDPPEDAGWQTSAITMQASHVVKGLKAGSKYWFRVGLVTVSGQQPYSDPLMLLVL